MGVDAMIARLSDPFLRKVRQVRQNGANPPLTFEAGEAANSRVRAWGKRSERGDYRGVSEAMGVPYVMGRKALMTRASETSERAIFRGLPARGIAGNEGPC